ncbi:hypothetical protein MNB_SV-4-849 [hydrothermal vent metagenome]|uniref:DUF3972 domain-containing protein n=1 Tax=hydrothermal vent metagenome TaxID=652676 RepID=A0A1W1E9A7_9ZZZZ
MEKLMKPAEYAKELGISRQAVYAKIKRGILTAKDVEGKLYIVVDTDEVEPKNDAPKAAEPAKHQTKPVALKPSQSAETIPQKDYEALLAAKDETIAVLKGTLKDLKKSNKQITTTLRGEIDLLKEAFHEMRTLYVQQIEQKSAPEAIDIMTEEVMEVQENIPNWAGMKKLFKALNVKKQKEKEKVLKQVKKAWKSGDTRVMKQEGKFKVDMQSDYWELVK